MRTLRAASLRSWSLLALVVATSAWAVLTPSAKVLGLTQAGDFFVYTVGFDDENPESYFLVSLRTGKQTELKKKEEFEAWTKTHPMSEDDAATGPKSADGKTELVLGPKGAWKGSDWSASDSKAPTCSVKGPGGALPCVSFSYRSGATLTPYWVPRTARVVWFSD